MDGSGKASERHADQDVALGCCLAFKAFDRVQDDVEPVAKGYLGYSCRIVVLSSLVLIVEGNPTTACLFTAWSAASAE